MRKYIEMEAAIVATIVLMTITFMASTAQEDQTTVPAPPQGLEGECWETILNCIGENVNNTALKPELDPVSSSFNVTEFLCCDLMQAAATTDKKCFCHINDFVMENPTVAANTTIILSACNIIDFSDISLDDFCA
ncbi:unnamed protein product [Amaranthus hypochondriacus]